MCGACAHMCVLYIAGWHSASISVSFWYFPVLQRLESRKLHLLDSSGYILLYSFWLTYRKQKWNRSHLPSGVWLFVCWWTRAQRFSSAVFRCAASSFMGVQNCSVVVIASILPFCSLHRSYGGEPYGSWHQWFQYLRTDGSPCWWLRS